MANGGFVAEKAQQRFQLDDLAKGAEQNFSIERLDKDTNTYGERGEFSLKKERDGHYKLVGKVSNYEKDAEDRDVSKSPLHEVSYDLAPLPPEAAQAIFLDIKKAAKEGGPEGNVNALMNRLIESAQNGSIKDYTPDGKIRLEVKIDMSEGQQAFASVIVYSMDGEPPHESRIPLEDLGTWKDF